MDEILRPEPGTTEYEQLKAGIAALRREISELTARRDDLQYRECPRIRAEYTAKIGSLELQVLEAQNRLQKLKLVMEILQAAENRREEKSSEDAEEEADAAYQEYEDDLKGMADDVKASERFREQERARNRRWRRRARYAGDDSGYDDAEDYYDDYGPGDEEDDWDDWERDESDGGFYQGEESCGEDRGEDAAESAEDGDENAAEESTGSKDENTAEGDDDGQEQERKFRSRNDELKYYYHELVKKLHPDANPDRTREDDDLLIQTVEAYKNGDLDKLKEIYEKLKERVPEREYQKTPEDIQDMREDFRKLSEKRDSLQEEIREIENGYPYRYKEILSHPELVEARQNDLREQLKSLEDAYQELYARYQEMAGTEGKEDPDGNTEEDTGEGTENTGEAENDASDAEGAT